MQYDLARTYLPHDHPMVMVQTVCLVEPDICICRVNVSLDSVLAPFLNEQLALPNFYCIELMAQTIGVWSGYHGLKINGTPKLGMLLGGRAIKTKRSEFPNGSELVIEAKLVLSDGKLANFDCNIKIAEQLVAFGKLNVYEPDDSELEYLFGSKRLGEK